METDTHAQCRDEHCWHTPPQAVYAIVNPPSREVCCYCGWERLLVWDASVNRHGPFAPSADRGEYVPQTPMPPKTESSTHLKDPLTA